VSRTPQLPAVWREAIYAVRGFRRDTTSTVTALLTLVLGTTAALTVAWRRRIPVRRAVPS